MLVSHIFLLMKLILLLQNFKNTVLHLISSFQPLITKNVLLLIIFGQLWLRFAVWKIFSIACFQDWLKYCWYYHIRSNADPERLFSMVRKICTDHQKSLAPSIICNLLSAKLNNSNVCYDNCKLLTTDFLRSIKTANSRSLGKTPNSADAAKSSLN